MVRPKSTIDWKKVDEMLIKGCRGGSIADYFGIHTDTLYLRCQEDHKICFTTYSQQKRSIGDDNIHKAQYELGVNDKNATMLIWLGKQRCGQREKEDDKAQMNPELFKHFTDFMAYIKSMQDQSARKMDDSNNNAEAKS